MHGEAGDQHPARVGRVEQVAHLRGTAVGRHADGQAGRVAVHGMVAEILPDLVEGGFARAGQVEPLGGDPPLQLRGRALRDQAARVQDRDPVGQPVGLL